jgi:hypothetical protein
MAELPHFSPASRDDNFVRRKEKHMAQDKKDQTAGEGEKPSDPQTGAMEEAQKEAAEEREEEGGYQ